ncbi:MAG: hypothetical protein ACOVP9_04905 [Flavobacterium stagni]
MKNLFLIFLGIVMGLNSNAQSKEWLSKGWQIDSNSMREVLKTQLETQSNYATLTESERVLALQTAMNKIASIVVYYAQDGTYHSETSKGKKVGTWTADFEKQLLTVIIESKSKNYSIKTLTANRLVLLTENGQELIFKPNLN